MRAAAIAGLMVGALVIAVALYFLNAVMVIVDQIVQGFGSR